MERVYGKFTLDELNIVLNELAKRKEEEDKLFHKWYVNQCKSNPKFKAIIEAKMIRSINRWLTLPADDPIVLTDSEIEMWLKNYLHDTI